MNGAIRAAFLAELNKIAQAKTLGAGMLSYMGRPQLATRYNNLYSDRVAKFLQWTVPGTKGIHLPFMNPARVRALSQQLAHPETALQVAAPGSPIHMPIAEAVKRWLPGVKAAV